jgi:hypothetical protein
VTIERVVVLAYILAVAMPPFGLALGIGLGLRVKSRHWPWIVLLSLVSAAVWAVIIGSGGLSSTNDSY